MDFITDSIKKNTVLWIILWLLLVLNLFTMVILSSGLAVIKVIFFILLALAGGVVIKHIADRIKDSGEEEPAKEEISALMQEIRPLCDDIFERQLDGKIQPLMNNLRDDFVQGLSWLGEDMKEFLTRAEEAAHNGRAIIQLIDSLSDEKNKLVSKINENLANLNSVFFQVERGRTNDEEEVNHWVEERIADLRKGMDKEKELFYNYVSNLLAEQMKEQDELDLVEYFNVYKLGEQFSVVIEKSLESRLAAFQDSVISDLEVFSADVVGRMQKNTLDMRQIFRDIHEQLDRLIESRSESPLVMRRLGDFRAQVAELEERAEEIMLTMAWQDILVEKRWQDLQEKLFITRDRVMENINEDVIDYIRNLMDEEIPGLTNLARDTSDTAIFYKSLIDAELVYQVYAGGKLPDLIGNGVYSLLQFVRPVEMLALKTIRLTEQGLRKRKNIRSKIKTGQYQPVFDKVKEALGDVNEALLTSLEDIFPRHFTTFCNYPYLKPRPNNLNQAAWDIFVMLADQEGEDQNQDLFLLTGLLLVIHNIRNHHIQPLKSQPIEVHDGQEVELMRVACYRAISIMLSSNYKGITCIEFKNR